MNIFIYDLLKYLLVVICNVYGKVFNEAQGKCYLCMLNVILVLFISFVNIGFYHSLQCSVYTFYLLFYF